MVAVVSVALAVGLPVPSSWTGGGLGSGEQAYEEGYGDGNEECDELYVHNWGWVGSCWGPMDARAIVAGDCWGLRCSSRDAQQGFGYETTCYQV